MPFRIFSALLVAAIMVMSQPAQALVYIKVLGGANLLDDTPLDGGASILQTNMGYNVAGAVGFNMGMFRLEGEVGYALNEIDLLTNVSGDGRGIGYVTSLSYMANVYFDLPLPLPIFTPYVTAGVGLAQVGFKNVVLSNASLVADGTDDVYAWQVGAGLLIKFMPLTRLVLDYRYFATEDPSVTDAFGTPTSFEYTRQTFRLGLRIGF